MHRLQDAAVLAEQAACLLHPVSASTRPLTSCRSHLRQDATSCMADSARVSEACRLLQQCLELRRQLLHADNELLGQTYHRLAGMQQGLQGLKHRNRAIECCQKACEAAG